MRVVNFLGQVHELRSIHGGKALAKSAKLLGEEDFETSLSYVSHTVLPPGASIGYHHHTSPREEVYTVLGGTGTYTSGDQVVQVGPGDVVVCGVSESHGLENTGSQDLELFIFYAVIP